MRKQSDEFGIRAYVAIRLGELYLAARKNEQDPWFQRRVEDSLSGDGFYWHPEIDTEGHVTPGGDLEWTPADHPDAERRAWLVTAVAYSNGHRRSEAGY